jgi:hypothetical protein
VQIPLIKGIATNGANVGFEADLFLAADKLRKNLEPSDYKPVVLGLISSDTFNFGPTIRTMRSSRLLAGQANIFQSVLRTWNHEGGN